MHTQFISWVGDWDGWKGKVGRDREGLMHTQFIRWLGIGGRGKVGRDWGGERNRRMLVRC